MISEKIKNLRKKKGLTMKALGENLGLSESTISLYEANKRMPDYETLLKMAEFFNVSSSYLLDEGIYKQKDLIIESRKFIEHYVRDRIGNEFAELIMSLDNEKFIHWLSTLVSKIEIDKEKEEVKIFFYFDNEDDILEAITEKGVNSINSTKPFPNLYSLKGSDDVIFLDDLPEEARQSMRDYFDFLAHKYK